LPEASRQPAGILKHFKVYGSDRQKKEKLYRAGG